MTRRVFRATPVSAVGASLDLTLQAPATGAASGPCACVCSGVDIAVIVEARYSSAGALITPVVDGRVAVLTGALPLAVGVATTGTICPGSELIITGTFVNAANVSEGLSFDYVLNDPTSIVVQVRATVPGTATVFVSGTCGGDQVLSEPLTIIFAGAGYS